MADDKYTFEAARIRLEEIAAEVRKKDTSLEKSLDLLEEGVRLANICTELVDHTDVGATVTAPGPEGAPEAAEVVEDHPVEIEVPAAAEGGDGSDDADGFEDADDAVGEPADADVDD